jgi:thioredoxin 2
MSTAAASLSPTVSGLVVACPSCGQRNRVPYARLDRLVGTAADGPRCGGCHTPLPALAQPLELADDAAFAALVDASPLPVLVDFWAA